MACEKVCLNTFNNNDPRNCITEIIKSIDAMQRKAVDREENCIGCIGPLIRKAFDTKPVMFTLCNDRKFTAYIGFSNERTDLFRIEDVMKECVLLRLLVKENECVRCTNQTVILKLDCICAIQCFEPVNCHIEEQCKF